MSEVVLSSPVVNDERLDSLSILLYSSRVGFLEMLHYPSVGDTYMHFRDSGDLPYDSKTGKRVPNVSILGDGDFESDEGQLELDSILIENVFSDPQKRQVAVDRLIDISIDNFETSVGLHAVALARAAQKRVAEGVLFV